MRWIIRLVLAVLVLAGLMVGGVFLLPADKVAALVQDQVRAATGRELTMSGRLTPSLWPEIGVATGPVTLSNADWSDAGPMLSAEGLSIGIDIKALIGGDIAIREIVAQSPRIVLERAADGQANWVFAGEAPAPGGAAAAGKDRSARAVTLDLGRISDGTVSYIDHATGTRTELAGLDATVALPAHDGPADLSLSATLNGQRLTAAARVARFADALGGGVSGVTVEAALGGARLLFDGRAGLSPLAADGALDADLSDLAGFFAALGQPAPDLPEVIGRRLGVAGKVTYAPEGSVHLREATIRQDENVLRGAADLTFGDRPRLAGQFTAGALDLSALTAGGGDGASRSVGDSAGAGGWSTAPIDVSALGALDAEIALAAESIDLGTVSLGPTRAVATLTDRRLVVDLHDVQGYGGRLTGNFVVNGRGGLSVGGDLAASGVAMQALLSALADYDRLIATGDLRLKFLGSGRSMAAIMQNLSGSGSVSFGKGELRGLDLVGMLRTLDTSFMGEGAKTIFDAITASFVIEGGVLRNDDLALRAPLLTATGAGTVGVGTRTLDYRVVPAALPGGDGKGGVRVPLTITGPWAAPRFRLDLEALADQELKDERKALEERAKARVAEELGVQGEEGESLEDAAKRKLEEEARKGLRKLFGGD
ncbi:AsmA family protein [Rhodovulum euryhalinum]|uniref:AsmA protein n=1 Tax=Rhodovulum euryhalinum TaxID=35805 RepID=A0A4R2KMP3_9RHOB|nr:AsmA family protein [Rhodovulum euryhalinum]TCO73922.1 AsmA protein [Rhodovulum euryhalinum]